MYIYIYMYYYYCIADYKKKYWHHFYLEINILVDLKRNLQLLGRKFCQFQETTRIFWNSSHIQIKV